MKKSLAMFLLLSLACGTASAACFFDLQDAWRERLQKGSYVYSYWTYVDASECLGFLELNSRISGSVVWHSVDRPLLPQSNGKNHYLVEENLVRSLKANTLYHRVRYLDPWGAMRRIKAKNGTYYDAHAVH